MVLAFSGSRSLGIKQRHQASQDLLKIAELYGRLIWHVGDCSGVDQIVREAAVSLAAGLVVHRAIGPQRWALAKRSREMVDTVRGQAVALIAFPVRPCPVELRPQSCDRWKGAGTWGTVAYAVRRGVPVDVQPLEPMPLPDWLQVEQMTLW